MSRFTQFSLLTIAIGVLVTGCAHPKQAQMVNHASHGRKLSDIHFSANLTQEQVVTIWGQPDGDRGSGIAYVEYTLEDGQEVLLAFLPEPPYSLQMAMLFSPHTGQRKTLFSE
jgi:hypothetical protein